MLKYAVILLDKTSVAFCHADNPFTEQERILLKTLKDAIFWAMKENLIIQFVYPEYTLPAEYLDTIDSIDHVDICANTNGNVVVLDGFKAIQAVNGKNVVIRTTFNDLLANKSTIVNLTRNASHISIILKDIDKLTDNDFGTYKSFLEEITLDVISMYKEGFSPQINLLTDRIVLDAMNNCNAGWETITVAPNGKFYLCPAFYYSDENDNVGSLSEGLDIKNPQLYRLDHAPICRNCDAYQCHRCIWLNRKTTYEVNTPSHEQCVMAHIERNASRDLLNSVRKHGDFLIGKDIPEIDYLDPFEKIVNK